MIELCPISIFLPTQVARSGAQINALEDSLDRLVYWTYLNYQPYVYLNTDTGFGADCIDWFITHDIAYDVEIDEFALFECATVGVVVRRPVKSCRSRTFILAAKYYGMDIKILELPLF